MTDTLANSETDTNALPDVNSGIPRGLQDSIQTWLTEASQYVFSLDTYLQLGVAACVSILAYLVSRSAKHWLSNTLNSPSDDSNNTVFQRLMVNLEDAFFPLLTLLFLKIAQDVSQSILESNWLLDMALISAVLIFFNSLVNRFIAQSFARTLIKYIGLPLLFLHMIDWLDQLIEILASVELSIGNISISIYGLARLFIFGSLLFWLGRFSNNAGKNIIRNQSSLDVSTREIFAKLFEVIVFIVIIFLLLNMMGINLTTLAVFGGAVGVGLGFGLQSIASNFISGIIILLDRSLTIGDYIEMEDGKCGFVREFQLRYTTLETYDGKDIMVPNEKFISTTFINWSHKDPKQRYRVDFSVAYATDIRTMVPMIKEVVSSHPDVINGDQYPFELQPDCEIDSFGDSGINMFVEFWIEGIDDGKNRIGGDLKLMIFEALKQHDIEIPFPQREVRML